MNDVTELEGTLAFGNDIAGTGSFDDGLSGSMDIGGVSVVCNTDYELLDNKPSIEGKELVGDKSLSDFGVHTLSNIEIKAIFDRVFRKD